MSASDCNRPTEAFGVTVHRDEEPVRVRVTGELDIFTAPQLDRVLCGLAAAGQDQLTVDLDDVEFMDSKGLGAIVRAKRTADIRGRLTVRHRSRQVEQLFEVTSLLDYLTIK